MIYYICYVPIRNLSNSGIGWPSQSRNSGLGWPKTTEYHATSENFICGGGQYYAGAALGGVAGIVLPMPVHSIVWAII